MIYTDKLNTKLKAIQDKDLDEIIANNTYIPYLGNSYTKQELQAWLDKRSDLLIKTRDEGELSLDSEKDTIYDSLTKDEKVIADKILINESNESYEFKTETEWEHCVPIILYKFVTTE